MRKAVSLAVVFSLVVISLSIAYYLAIFIPQKEYLKLEQEKRKLEIESENKRDEAQKEIRQAERREELYIECEQSSTEYAKDLLKTKSELVSNSTYKNAVEKGLYLKDDYQDALDKCLDRYGLK